MGYLIPRTLYVPTLSTLLAEAHGYILWYLPNCWEPGFPVATPVDLGRRGMLGSAAAGMLQPGHWEHVTFYTTIHRPPTLLVYLVCRLHQAGAPKDGQIVRLSHRVPQLSLSASF